MACHYFHLFPDFALSSQEELQGRLWQQTAMAAWKESNQNETMKKTMQKERALHEKRSLEPYAFAHLQVPLLCASGLSHCWCHCAA